MEGEEDNLLCLVDRVGTVISCVCYIKMSIFVIVLSVYAVNVCVHADLYTAHLLEWKEEEKNHKRIMAKARAGQPHLNASSGLYYQEGCFSWPAPSPENQVD